MLSDGALLLGHRLHQGAPLFEGGEGQRRAIHRDDGGFAGHTEERVHVSTNERGQLFEPLAFDRLGIGVAVVTARDVEGHLGGGGVPGVRPLLAQHGEDVAEHVTEGVRGHGTNLKGHPSVTIACSTVVLWS